MRKGKQQAARKLCHSALIYSANNGFRLHHELRTQPYGRKVVCVGDLQYGGTVSHLVFKIGSINFQAIYGTVRDILRNFIRVERSFHMLNEISCMALQEITIIYGKNRKMLHLTGRGGS
jgi:hypothetical protein